MPDETRADLNRRLACVRGHLAATIRMIELGEDDLAVAQQIRAVRGALTQIQIHLLRAWAAQWLQEPADPQQIECDLTEILKCRR